MKASRSSAARRFVLGAAAAVALLALAGPAASRVRMLHGNNFFSNCYFSHTAPDDPIVHLRRPGESHPHTFFGNSTTNAFSTLASLRAGKTSCRIKADTAAYWVPTLFDNGHEVRPAKAQIYYVLRGYDRMRAFPPGLRMVAGNPMSMQPQNRMVVYWACGASGVRARISSRPPECGVIDARFHGVIQDCASCPKRSNFMIRRRTYVELHVNFPDCWDGRHLDSPDHQSHMAYSRDFICPASHPVKVPLIRLMIRYPITDGTGLALASGGQLTGHADFFNAWKQAALERLVDACFHDRPCNH